MSLSQTASPEPARGLARFDPFRFLKRFLPRGLFWRSLLIIVTPMVLLQGVVSYVFFERDLDTTTRWMARDIAADAAFLVALEDSHTLPERAALRAQAARHAALSGDLPCRATIDPPARRRRPSTIDLALDDVIAQQIGATAISSDQPHRRGFRHHAIEVHDGVLRMMVPRDRVTVSSPDIFIVWMVGSALILLAVAVLFLRNQVRPIEQLARASEAFGKGRAGARLQALWRDRSAPRGAGLPHHARTHRAPCAAAHRNAGRRQPRPEDAADAHEAGSWR